MREYPIIFSTEMVQAILGGKKNTNQNSFQATTTKGISIFSNDYEAQQAPCLNGGEHEFEQMAGAPKAYFVGRKRCVVCGVEIVDEATNKAAIAKYILEPEEIRALQERT